MKEDAIYKKYFLTYSYISYSFWKAGDYSSLFFGFNIPGVPEVLSITFSSINQKVYIAGRKTKYQHNLHLMAIQIKTEQSRKVII